MKAAICGIHKRQAWSPSVSVRLRSDGASAPLLHGLTVGSRRDPRSRARLDRNTRGEAHGFTAIELIIVMAILGVLVAIALPSYFAHVQRGYRAQAKQFAGDLANREEQYLLDQRAYTTVIGAGGLATSAPSETAGYYTFAIATTGTDCLGAALPVLGYTITATAVGTQASDGNLCLDSLNQKTPATKWSK